MTSIVSLYNSLFKSRRDKQITKLYQKTIPEEMFNQIETSFDINKFTGTFSQVATSVSTIVARTGITYSNVKATYDNVDDKEKQNTHVSVLNRGMDSDYNFTSINGESRPRIGENNKIFPGCRTVYFKPNERYQNQNFDRGFEGDYWVLYATEDMTTIVVGIPIIVFGRLITSNFGVYVLTKDPENFWQNETLRNKVMYYITKNEVFNPEKDSAKLCLKKPFQSWYSKPIPTALTFYPTSDTNSNQQEKQ